MAYNNIDNIDHHTIIVQNIYRCIGILKIFSQYYTVLYENIS